jgi:hypothetical protein
VTESVVQFLATREKAEAFIAEVKPDESETAARLRLETVGFEQAPN